MEGETFVNARWTQFGVSSIERVEIYNKEYFQEDVQVHVGPYYAKQRRSIQGVLKNFDLKITFTMPYDFQPEDLSVEVAKSRTLISDEILVRLGAVDASRDQLTASSQVQQHTIIIPVETSIVDPPTLDKFLSRRQHEQNHFFHHYTICVEGVRWPSSAKCMWRIRSKVNYTTSEVEIVSVTDDFIDKERIRTSFGKFVDMMREAFCDLRKSICTHCPCRRRCNRQTAEDKIPLAQAASVQESHPQSQMPPAPPPSDNSDPRLLEEQMMRAQLFQQFLRQQQELLEQQIALQRNNVAAKPPTDN